jgi:hypothetical protein
MRIVFEKNPDGHVEWKIEPKDHTIIEIPADSDLASCRSLDLRGSKDNVTRECNCGSRNVYSVKDLIVDFPHVSSIVRAEEFLRQLPSGGPSWFPLQLCTKN